MSPFSLLFGCSNNNTAKVKLASQKLSSSLDQVIVQVKKLETIDEEKMAMDSILGDYVNEDYFTQTLDNNQDTNLSNRNNNMYNVF